MTSILLRDEVRLSLDAARSFLRQTGCEVLTATTWKTTRELARTRRRDAAARGKTGEAP